MTELYEELGLIYLVSDHMADNLILVHTKEWEYWGVYRE